MKIGVKLKKFLIFELFSETRKYEVGIVSSHKSERYGEKVIKICTNCPSHF